MVTFCPRCGAEFPVEVLGELVRTSVRCPDCHLALTEVPPQLAPSEEEIGYELSDWPVTDRGPVTAALAAVDIPYRWESGLVLVVPAAAEGQVDRLLDDLQGEQADEAGAAIEAEGDDTDGAEEAQTAMADLFVAADRLQHSPFDKGAADDLAAAAATVGACLPPYGIERPVWRQIGDLATAVVSGLEEAAEDDVVAANARALRDFLRDYV